MSREETLFGAILSSIRGETPTVPEPAWREEEFFCAILRSAQGEKPAIPAPVWRREEYLAAIAQTLQENQPVPTKDVNFFDYDGTLVASYTAAEFAELDAMPRNPIRKGLVAQGWNWTLADAKTHVAKYGRLIVGQQYITADGKTHLYIRLRQGRTAPYLGLGVNGSAVVDWGDGSDTTTLTGSSLSTIVYTSQHEYPAPGEYEITIAVTGEAAILGVTSNASALLSKKADLTQQNVPYTSAVRAVELGENMNLGAYAFHSCLDLLSISLPNTLTSIPERAFYLCNHLRFVCVPSGVTSLGALCLSNMVCLLWVSIPKSVATIGDTTFAYSYSIYELTIPEGIAAIPKEFVNGVMGMERINVPDGVTSIGNTAFASARGVTELHIPASVTSIGTKGFADAASLAAIHFHSNTPPTLGGSNAFDKVPADCKIYVPAGKLSAYTSAANYPSSGTYTYVEEDA